MKKYKKYGFAAFKSGKYELAKVYFSLAKDFFLVEDLFLLISLCGCASKDPKRANFIFDLYISKKKSSIELSPLVYELENYNNNIPQQKMANIDCDLAISYEEFMDILKKKKSKEIIENLLFSRTKLVISSKKDFLNFINLLADYNMTELGIEYLEMMLSIYAWDEDIKIILNKMHKNENTNAK